MCPVQRCQMILIHHDQFLHNYELNKMKKVKQTFINALNIVEMVLNQVRCQHELITPHIKTLSGSSKGTLHEKMANVQCSFLFCVRV